jgi:hypothetical protein
MTYVKPPGVQPSDRQPDRGQAQPPGVATLTVPGRRSGLHRRVRSSQSCSATRRVAYTSRVEL